MKRYKDVINSDDTTNFTKETLRSSIAIYINLTKKKYCYKTEELKDLNKVDLSIILSFVIYMKIGYYHIIKNNTELLNNINKFAKEYNKIIEAYVESENEESVIYEKYFNENFDEIEASSKLIRLNSKTEEDQCNSYLKYTIEYIDRLLDIDEMTSNIYLDIITNGYNLQTKENSNIVRRNTINLEEKTEFKRK